jgi:DNA modification methylase
MSSKDVKKKSKAIKKSDNFFSCSYKEIIPIADLKPHPKNPNIHTEEQLKRLAKIIEYQGQRHPVIISRLSGYIVAGHGRSMAIKKLGINEIAVDYQDFENEEQEYAFLISDNAIAEWSSLDLDLIKVDIDIMGDFDVDMLGIKDFKIESEIVPGADEDEVPEVKEDPTTKRGDVWLLGKHRLMCGDSTMIDYVEKLMKGEKADISFTSPPYNAGTTPTEVKMNKKSKYSNDDDNKEQSDYTSFLSSFTNNAILNSEYVFVNIQSLSGNKSALIEYLYLFKDIYADTIIWDKRIAQPAMAENVLNSQFEYVHVFSKKANRAIGVKKFRGTLSNVLQINRQSKNEVKDHNATFPVEFAEFFVSNFSENTVLDLFCGSGTTLIACEKTNRKCYGMELDEHYCDVIIQRWQKYTGKEAILESNGKTYNKLKNEKEK